MGFLEERYAKKKEEFYSHVPVWVAVGAEACKAAGRRLTWEEYIGLIKLLGGANSYTHKVLLLTLDDLAVCRLTDYYMSQSGRDLGELDLAEHYGDAVQRELAPLLVKRLREAADYLATVRQYAEEWGRWRETIAHLKKSAVGQQKRADKLEADFLDLQRDWLKATEARAAWEVQAQDLRDRLVESQSELARVDGELRRRNELYTQEGERALKAERERDALQAIGTKLADYLETATEIIEDDAGDEEDVADARRLIAKAREILPPNPELCGMAGHSRGCDCRGAGGDR